MTITLIVLTHLTVAVSCLSLSWLLTKHFSPASTQADATDSSEDAVDLQSRRQEFSSLAERIRELTESLVYDVGEHHESIQQANTQLQNETGEDVEAVLRVIAKVIKTNVSLQQKLETAEERLFVQAQAIESRVHEANTDALTGVGNRRAFDHVLESAVAQSQRSRSALTVMMLDVDHFKKFNDANGHQAGDEALKMVARTLKRKIRRQGSVFRYGGEELALVFNGTPLDKCRDLADQARAVIGDACIDFKGRQLKVTASAGLAQLAPGESGEQLVKRADEALYHAKASGRNRMFWHNGRDSREVVKADGSKKSAPPATVVSNWTLDLMNPGQFHEALEQRIAEWRRGGACISLGVLNVDGWAELVAERGEQVADRVLKATSQFLRASVRDMDNVALLDHGCFGVMFPNAKLENVEKIGERLRAAIARCEIPCESGKMNFTISIGVAEVTRGDNAGRLRERAEMAVEAATHAGGNLCFSSTVELNKQVTRAEPSVAR